MIISHEKFLMSGYACTCRHLSITLLIQRIIIFMIFLSTPEQRRAMAQAAQREQTDTSLASNPRFGPQKPTAVLRVFDIIVGVMFSTSPSDS